MSIVAGSIVIEMSANMARLKRDFDAAQKAVDSATAGIKKSAELASKALGALGIGLSVGMFAEWVRGAIDAADRMNDLSKSTGIAVTQLAGLKLAAKQSGGDLDGIAASINKLSVNIGGNAEKFAQLGITAKDPLEAFKQLSDIFVGIQDPQLRAAVAAEALGKSWASAAPLLAEGGAKIGEMVAKGADLSKMTPELAAAADRLNDTLVEIWGRSDGLKSQLATSLIPSLQRTADAMNGASIGAQAMSLAIQGVGAVFDGIVFVGGTAINILRTAGVEIKGIYDVLGAVTTGVIGGGFDGVKAAIDRTKASVAEIASAQVAFRESFIVKPPDDEMARFINKQSDAIRRNSAAMEERARAFLKGNEAQKESVDLYAKMIKQADDLVASIQFETKLLTVNNVEKETAVALQKLANMGIKEGTKEYEKYSEAIIAATLDKAQVQSIIDSNKRIEEARLDAIKKADEAQKKMEEDAAKQLRDISNQVGQSLADALMNGGKSAKQYLQDLFRTLILRPIVQPLITGSISGILMGAAGTATAAGIGDATGGSMSGSLGLMSTASSLKNLYEMATGSFASLGDSVTEALINAGETLWSGGEGVLSAAGEAMINSAGAIGAAAEMLGGVGAGLGIGNLISGGLGVGGSSWNTVGGGTALGAAIGSIIPGLGTALGAAAGGILGGLVNKMFGSGAKEYGAAGITGTYSATGASIQNFQEWSKAGGWFSGGSSGTDFSPADATLQTTLSKTLAGISLSVANFTRQLGESAAGVSQFSQSITLDVAGLSAADAQTKVQASLTAFGDSMAAFVLPAIANYQKVNESAGSALNRLATSLTTVNGVFGTLNLKLMETSLAGADAADKLAALFGGTDAFIQATNAYYQNFYTEQERSAKTTEQLSAVFNQLGLTMPSTKDAFRSMVEAARAAGDNTLFANLLKLAPTFNDLQTSLANLATTGTNATGVITDYSSQLNTALSNVKSALSAEQDATLAIIDSQIAATQAAKDAATATVSSLKSIFDYLAGQVNDLNGLIAGSQNAQEGANFVHSALLIAQSTGGLPSQDALTQAVSAARSGLIDTNYSSSFDMKLAQAKLASALTGLMGIAGHQQTTAEIQVELAQEQIDSLNAQANDVKNYYAAQLAYAQAQVDQLSGINGGVLSVGDAMAALAGVVNTARQAQAQAQAQAQPSTVSQGTASMQAQIEGLYNSILGRGSDPIGLANWMAAAAGGKSIDQIRQEFINSAEYQSMPHFASGGAYDGGLALVGERGPELINFTSPGTVYTANQTRGIMGGGAEVANEVRALREETAKQREDNRAQSLAVVKLQARMTKLLERWEGDGLPETRVVTA